MHRVALALARRRRAGMSPAGDRSGSSAPRTHVFDEAFDPVWDESLVDAATAGIGPRWWRMAHLIQGQQSEYDAIVTWGERLSLALLAQQRFSGSHKPHIAMIGQFEKPNIRLPLTLLKRDLHAVVTWTSVQRRALVEKLRFPSERVYLVRHFVDQVFYSPRSADEHTICAVGAEMRDYATLLEAMRGTGIPCHIATDHVRVPGRFRLFKDRRMPISEIRAGANPSVTCGRLALSELRELYARSRFVVVPLVPSNSDNGVTVILEAMAMGKPVICSRTRGQVDVIQEGVTGLYVPVGDAAALRAAIQSLWHEPLRAKEMGRHAREYVERYHTLEGFASATRSAVEASLDGRPATDTWWS